MIALLVVSLVTAGAPAALGSARPSDGASVSLSASGAPSLGANGFETLTLEQALEAAEKNNLDLVAARARLDQSAELSRKVWANYLPSISAGANYQYNNVEARIALPSGYYIRDVFQPQGPAFDPTREPGIDNPPGAQTNLILVPSGLTEAPIQVHHQFGAQVQVNQTILAPALWPAIQSAYLGEKVAELSVENARREILFGVAQLYFGAVTLKEVVQIQERLLEQQAAHEKNAQIRFEAGAVPKMLLLRAQIERARTEQDLLRARNSYRAARISLGTLLDRSPEFEVVHPDVTAAKVDPAQAASEQAERRPDIAAAKTSVELAEASRRTAWFKFLPNVGANGTYRWANVTGFTGQNTSWFVGVGLNWVIWDGGLREAELRESAAKMVEAQAQLRNAENKAKDELQRAIIDAESARANATKAQEQLKLARENASIIDVNFKAGVATYLEVADANTALRAAELGAVTEQLNAELAELRIAKAAGTFGVK